MGGHLKKKQKNTITEKILLSLLFLFYSFFFQSEAVSPRDPTTTFPHFSDLFCDFMKLGEKKMISHFQDLARLKQSNHSFLIRINI